MTGTDAAFASNLSPDRARLLKTKAAMVIAVPATERQTERAWQRITDPPDVADPSLIWVIDGYKRYGAAPATATTGCGVTVIDSDGNFVSAARATPPQWICTSYAAEVWALWLAVQACPFCPNIVTDCKAILGTLRPGAVAATAGKKKLARAWK